MFKLARHFSLTSAAAIVLITSAFVLAFHAHERRHVVAETHERNLVLSHVIANGPWPRYGLKLQRKDDAGRLTNSANEAAMAFDRELDVLTERVSIFRLRVVAPDGVIRYSTVDQEIGSSYTEARPIDQVFRTAQAVTFLSTHAPAAGHDGKAEIDVAETYFPLLDSTGKVVAVLEIYVDITTQRTQIRRDVALVALLMGTGFAVLYLILFAIVRRADRILRGQYDELGRANALLEERVRHRTCELETSALELGRTNDRLREEIEERRRAEAALADKRHTLLAQHAAVKELIRVGTLEMSRPEETMRALTETAARTLDVGRVSIWLVARGGDCLECLDLFEREAARHSKGFELVLADVPIYRNTLLSGGLIAADDAATHPATAEFKSGYVASRKIGSMLDIPVVRGGRIEGVLSCETVGCKTTWSPEQQVFAVTIANLVAQMLESRDRECAVAENRSRTDALLRHQETIGAIIEDGAFRTGDRNEALGVISRRTTRSLGVDRTTIWLTGADGKAFSFGSVYIAASDTFETPPWISDPAFATAMLQTASDRMLAIGDTCALHPLADVNDTVYLPNDIRSVLVAPIKVHGRTIGFLTCATVGRRIEWSADHKLVLASVVNLAALALERHERERAEAELRLVNRRLEAATRAKSEFLANMSHEIRTPMNAVFGMTDLLARTELNARQRRLVGTISQSAKTLLTIINDILDISRIEAGRLALERREFDLRHIVEGVGELFAEEAHAKGLDVTVFIDDRTPQTVVGDHSRLRQVLVNLLGNAVKFTPRGAISLRVTPDAARESHITFAVSDTGIGIDPAVQPSLFGAFTQADSSISRRYGGTGLGLSISRHLVRLMGGEVGLESEPGRGTTVTFSIPLEAGTGQAAKRLAPLQTRLAGRRLLVVDGHAASRENVASYLAGVGAELATAASAGEMQAALGSANGCGRPIELVLIDEAMREGAAGLAQPGSPAPAAQPRLILLASLASRTEARAARELGVDAVLSKPVRRADLIEAVATALTRANPAAREEPARPAPPPASWPGRQILVVEDNPVNVEVAREYLEYYRCRCEVAHNGLEALAAVEKREYDLVLMDVQMPEMDGLTATRRIREREATLGTPRTPIIGVTANAYDDDRRACMEAGMDGYLSKPFDESQIRAVLGRWLAPATEAGPAREAAPDAVKALNEGTIAALEASRPELLYRMVGIYLDYAPKTIASLRKAIDGRDLIAVKLGAHSLKSSSANVGGEVLSALLRRLETAANVQDEPLAVELFADVECEFARLKTALEQRVPVRDAAKRDVAGAARKAAAQ